MKDKMVQDLTNLLREVEAHYNHQMVGVEEPVHCSQKGVEECLSNQQVEKEHNWDIINVSGVAHAPLDTTGLENSFENLGRTMVDVLTIQQQTNLTLQDQIKRANDAQMEQTLAMHDLADMTEQRTYDSMFTAVPIYHGNDDEDFDEWADQLEALCEISR